ncbi:Odorant receptor [Nesidiocoris tenuis]|uniref:Odorant receptor n=1 Tax=Nesidiocoris tenuis TaxID=355587 RepID=A0ABN7AHZ7_9HEMI|nr:Odorant receptor [Nesidiocoris tenuis]
MEESDQALWLTEVTCVATGTFGALAPPRILRPVMRVLAWYHTSMFILFMISALLNAFLAKDFFNESLESAHFLVTGLHLFSKFMTMMRREREYLNLLQDIRKCWNGFITNNPKHKEYMLRASTRADRTTIIIFSSICNVLTVNMLNSLVKNMIEPEKMHFPVQLYLPPQLSRSYAVGAAVQIIVFSSPVMIISTTTSFLNSITVHVEALGASLAEDIRSMENWQGEPAIRVYKKHQEIIRLVHGINRVMSGNWGFEMACASVQLTLPAYRALRALKRNEVEVINHCFITLLNFSVIYLIYTSGSKIYRMGEDVRNSVYESQWLLTPAPERKNLIFVMMRANKPLEYKYKVFRFDLPGFTKVVNTVFSYMAVLRFLDGHDSGPRI